MRKNVGKPGVDREGGPFAASVLKGSFDLNPLCEEGALRFRKWAEAFRAENPQVFSGKGKETAERLISMMDEKTEVFCANRARDALEKLALSGNLDYADFELGILESWKEKRTTHFAREKLAECMDKLDHEEKAVVEFLFKQAMDYANEERAPTEEETKRLIITLWMLRGAMEQKKKGEDALVFLKNMTYVYECL